MRSERDRKRSRADEKPRVEVVNAIEQTRRVQEAVARRAYEIFESRGSAPWHELEDWRQAEAELVGPQCTGEISLDGTLWVSTDATIFEPGTVEIWVAPRKITICGKASADNVNAHQKHIGARQGRQMIFQWAVPGNSLGKSASKGAAASRRVTHRMSFARSTPCDHSVNGLRKSDRQ